MSGALRKALRDAVSDAMLTLPQFQKFSAWQQTVDASALPGWAVAIPNSRHSRQDNIGTTEHSPMLVIVLKRAGSAETLEDDLDDDADEIVPLIISATKTNEIDCELVETAQRVDRSGAEPIGTLTLQFQITTYL